MPFYWCVASLRVGFWIVEDSSAEHDIENFSTVPEAIANAYAILKQRDKHAERDICRRIVLVGRVSPPNKNAADHRPPKPWRWLLATDLSNKPAAYIIATSKNRSFSTLHKCINNVKQTVTVSADSEILEEPWAIFQCV